MKKRLSSFNGSDCNFWMNLFPSLHIFVNFAIKRASHRCGLMPRPISKLLLSEDFGRTRTHMCEWAKLSLGTSGNTKMSSLMQSKGRRIQIVSVWGFRPHPHAHGTRFSEPARVRMCEIISWNLGKYQDEFVDEQHVRNDLQNGRHSIYICEVFLLYEYLYGHSIVGYWQNFFHIHHNYECNQYVFFCAPIDRNQIQPILETRVRKGCLCIQLNQIGLFD